MFQCVIGEVVIAVDGEEQFARSFPYTAVDRTVFASVFLPNVPDRDASLCLKLANNSFGVVGATVVDNQPFEITETLTTQAFVQCPDQMGTVVGGSEYGH